MRRTSGRVVALLVTGMLALSACTGAPGDEPAGSGSAEDGVAAGGEAAAPVEETGSARTVTGSMAETTSDIPGDSGAGGTLTLTLRSVDVSEQTMTVRWATRWDSEDAEPDAAVSYYDMGLGTAASVIDATNLKVYRPFCTDGSWKAGGVDAVRCKASMLTSARDEVFTKFPNHGTVEGWASLPAPEGKPKSVDVIPIEGLAGFTQAEVTYLDGGS
ncbi:hypothetical protein APR04_001504 [Promicromonospora umidemergens]|uniref:Lipoprotein n=1 Tax=Promicromonospora umidemergens TaxID=629679 RepID=A0ABP8Y8X9_9MICO|nr:hypothetical protein [Promicromonospora umidemergens]MCP2282606.1 hypothetical protein [Promicromonospora umidemergens]